MKTETRKTVGVICHSSKAYLCPSVSALSLLSRTSNQHGFSRLSTSVAVSAVSAYQQQSISFFIDVLKSSKFE